MISTLPRTARASVLLGTVTVLLVVLTPPVADAVVTPRVRWSEAKAVVGAKVTATVAAGSRPHGSRLVLQRRNLDGWRTVDPVARRTDRGFVLRLPTDQIGRFSFRVAARRAGEIRSVSTHRDVRVRPAYDPAGRRSDHRFLGDRRFRWDSCQPVRWAFNPAHAPRRALRLVRDTIRLAGQATGLTFDFVGRTARTPTLASHHRRFDIVVGWRTPRSFAYFRQHPGRVGIGGASWRSGFEEADGTRVRKARSGRLILNARYIGDLGRGYGRGYTWGDVLLHEFGHVLGLGHAGTRHQHMFPQMTKRRAHWGAGDLAGLRRLGSGRGCLERTHVRKHGRSTSALSAP